MRKLLVASLAAALCAVVLAGGADTLLLRPSSLLQVDLPALWRAAFPPVQKRPWSEVQVGRRSCPASGSSTWESEVGSRPGCWVAGAPHPPPAPAPLLSGNLRERPACGARANPANVGPPPAPPDSAGGDPR